MTLHTIRTHGTLKLPLRRDLEPGESHPEVWWGPVTVRKRRLMRDAEHRFRVAMRQLHANALGDDTDRLRGALDAFQRRLHLIHSTTDADACAELIATIPDLLDSQDLVTAPAEAVLELEALSAAEQRDIEVAAVLIDGWDGVLDAAVRGATPPVWPSLNDDRDPIGRRTAALCELPEHVLAAILERLHAELSEGLGGLDEADRKNSERPSASSTTATPTAAASTTAPPAPTTPDAPGAAP